MTKFEAWHPRQEVTSELDARRAVETFRRNASWVYVPAPQIAEVLYVWFRRGWCLAAINRAWEITPDNKPQRLGDPDTDPLGTLERRLAQWRDGLGTPKDPPIEAMSAEQIQEIQRRRSEQDHHRQPASDATRAHLRGQWDSREAVRRERSVQDRVAHGRAMDNDLRELLAELDRLGGAPEPTPLLVEPEDQFHPAESPVLAHAKQAGHEDFLSRLAQQVRERGIQSLTKEQRAVLRARWRGYRDSSAMDDLDRLINPESTRDP